MTQATDIVDRLRESPNELNLEAAKVIHDLREALLSAVGDCRDAGKFNRAEIYLNIVRENSGTPVYQDYEVIGLDADGQVVQWDAGKGESYSSGMTTDQFGVDCLSAAEKARCNINS